MATEFPSGTSPDAPAIAASLMYGMMLEPLQSAFGDFGSLITSALASLPLRDANDALGTQFKQLFSQGEANHG